MTLPVMAVAGADTAKWLAASGADRDRRTGAGEAAVGRIGGGQGLVARGAQCGCKKPMPPVKVASADKMAWPSLLLMSTVPV